MYVNPIILGALSVIVVEIIALFVYAIVSSKKNNK
jgi:hypothetical protein